MHGDIMELWIKFSGVWNNVQVFAPDIIFCGYDLRREREPEMQAKIQPCQVLYVCDEFSKTKREITHKKNKEEVILWTFCKHENTRVIC